MHVRARIGGLSVGQAEANARAVAFLPPLDTASSLCIGFHRWASLGRRHRVDDAHG